MRELSRMQEVFAQPKVKLEKLQIYMQMYVWVLHVRSFFSNQSFFQFGQFRKVSPCDEECAQDEKFCSNKIETSRLTQFSNKIDKTDD